MRLTLERWASPVASLLLVTDDDGALRALDYADHEARMHRLLHLHYGAFTLRDGESPRSIKKPLAGYFRGEIDALDEVSVATGGTAFQRDVWQALRLVRAGSTVSYGELAT